MASGFFALLDDIAAIMDDVATMTKVSTKKTAGILGDDLAVNAEKASGFRASRELPVLWAISKGSLINKIIILPLAFLLSAFLPWSIPIILVLGAFYLAYEGVEKIYEFIIPHEKPITVAAKKNLSEEELLKHEKAKIKSAIFTDFILSVEIIIIALGTVVNESLLTQVLVVSIVAFIATVGVYGIVGFIVRMDDVGYKLVSSSKNEKGIKYYLGVGLIKALPLVVKGLSVIGTLALLLVAGGIFHHYIDVLHDFLPNVPEIFRNFILGILGGIPVLLLVKLIKILIPNKNDTSN